MKCPDCQKDFPADLLDELEVGGDAPVRRVLVCPLCALALVNRVARLPPGTPFRGPLARALHRRAVDHLKATGQIPGAGAGPGRKRIEDMTEPELARLMKDMAKAVEKAAADLGVEKPHFALVVFNDPKVGQYVANCERASIIEALRETAARLERKEDVPR